MSPMGQERTSGRPQTNTATRGKDNPDLGELARLRIIEVQRIWPPLETGLDRVVIGAIVVARENP